MASNKWLLWIVFILILINIGMVTTLWLTKPPQPPHPSRAGRMAQPPLGEQQLLKELQLSEPQAEQFRKLRERHEEKVTGVLDSLHALKDLAFRSVLNDAGDMHTSQALMKRAAEFEYTLDTLTLNHVAALRSVCTREQRGTFDSIFHEFIGPSPQQEMPAPHR